MILLSVDTSTTSYSVALLDRDRTLLEVVGDPGQTHSRHLMGTVEWVMKRSGLEFSQLTALAACQGPGSFTGLRIGLAGIQGLASSLNIPVVGVSSLLALASGLGHEKRPVWAALDARRGEVYTACFQSRDQGMERLTGEQALSPEKWMEQIHDQSVLLGNGALLYKEELLKNLGQKACFAPPGFHLIRASVAGRLAMESLDKGLLPEKSSLSPTYIRPSDARLPA